ncbi:MAG TPA: alpha/beta hydrolase [Usitatibacter sp.]|jgi:acetyl esterase/lipase|nr:alpha/beta hydrolase [Usitatibacter sp.]
MRFAAVLAAACLLAGCAQALLNAVTPRDDFTAARGIAFEPGPRGALDVYMPADGAASHPVVVFFYGGYWDSGDREAYLFVGEAFASRGIVAIIPDYRIYPEVTFPAFVEDGAAAVAWASRNVARYGGDPSRIFVAGHSAGAHIAAMVALDSRYLSHQGVPSGTVKGLIGLAGPYDFLIDTQKLQRIFPEATWRDSQPVNFVTGSAPPALLLAGSDDTTVNPDNTRSLARHLRAAGVPVTEHIYEGYGHVKLVAVLGAPLRSHSSVLDEVSRFVRGAPSPGG